MVEFRQNKYGKTYPIGGSNAYGAVKSPLAADGVAQTREPDERRTFRFPCPRGCGELVWFVRPEQGGCFFCDDLGGDWPPHACFPRQEHAPATPVPASSTQAATRKVSKSEVAVIGVWPVSSDTVLVMVWLYAERLPLPLLGREVDDWSLCEGRLEFGARTGCLTFTPSDHAWIPKTVFGPIFDCRNLSVWESGDGSVADLLALGRDLGIRRHEHYPGQGLVGYVAPKWRDALRLYLPAIFDGDAEALNEAIDLIELPAKGAMGHADERAVVRLRRELRRATDRDAHDRIFEELLEHLHL